MLVCDVCGRPAKGVACSSTGAVSYAYCEECLEHNAEPEGEFEFLYQTVGKDVAEWVYELTTYVEDTYVPYAEWVKNKEIR